MKNMLKKMKYYKAGHIKLLFMCTYDKLQTGGVLG